MFSDNLGFNPFDKSNSDTNHIYSKAYITEQHRFLSSFRQNNIFVYNGNPRKKISSMNHTDNLEDALKANISNHSDVYFYVNGGRKMYAIKQFTCCFCDIDAGRDSDGKYFKPSVVMTKKKQFLKKINDFPVKPSWVVDTRNGYQCYWIFDDASRKIVGSNKTFWNGLQKKLVNYFDGDPRAIKPNQIYRVPYTWWRKEWEKKAPYFTSILSGSTGQPINVVDLKSALTGQPATLQIIPEKCSDEWYKGYAKAYKQSDMTGVPVTVDVASKILNELQNAGPKGLDKYAITERVYGDPVPVNPIGVDWTKVVNDNMVEDEDDGLDELGSDDTDSLTSPLNEAADEDISLDGSQTKLLKTVVEIS